MPTRKPRNAELSQAVDSLNDAAKHVRKAVQDKIEQLRGTAAAEIARAKASLLKKTNLAQDRVDSVLKKTEARLHKAIMGAQKALDKAVAQAEKRSLASAPAAPAAPAKKAATGTAARKAPAAKKATRTKRA